TMMLGLRTTRGVSEESFLRMHGQSLDAVYGEKLRMLEAQGLLLHADGCWRLTRRGMDVQNSVLVTLMDD
ncbi:MAG: coproporphyrinogen III oxidase, partial [Aristaeellaceae bacterium]